MKKIKGILLFGILTLLGIGSSFGYLYDITEVSFKSDSNKYINFGFVPGNTNTYSNYYHYYSNTGSLQKLNILRKSTTLFPGFDLSSYSLTTFGSYSYTSKKYYLSDSCADVIVTGSSYGIISHIYGLSGCNSQNNLSSDGIGSNGLFYVNGGDNCINSGVLNTNTCDYSFYKTFGAQTFDSRYGLYSDNQYSGSDYGKTSISFPFSDSYSFFGNIARTSDGNLPEVYHYSQKYLYYSGGDFNYIGGLYVARINDLNSYDGNSGFQVIALSLSGGFNDSDLTNNYFNYGIFDCPVSAQNLFDCSFSDGGTTSSLYTNSSITGNVLRFLSTSYSFYFPGNSNTQYLGRSIKNYYNRTSNYIYFYRFLSPYNASSSSGQPKLISTTFQLISDGNNYFESLFSGGGGNGNQSVEPIFDYNTYVINDLIVCYITSGEICSYNTFNRSAFESTFDVSDSFWNGTTGFLLGGNASLFLKEFCLNSSLIDYPYCSQLDLYSGSAIFIDYVNGLLSYQILGDGIIVSIDGLGSGQLGNTSCWGGNCSSVNTGLPDFIRPSDSEYYSGIFIDTGYFDDFYNLNITGYFMRCPFSYESNRVVIGQAVINKLGGRDPFVFINCMIAAFNEGKKFIFLNHIDFPGPLMSLTGSDQSPILGIEQVHNRKILFGFFDCLLSFGLLLLIRFFYRLFK